MKRILTIAIAALMVMSTAVLFGGCGENDQNQSKSSASDSSIETDKKPSEAIIGTWGGRSDKTEIKFNEDGTCEIGGVAGNYKVDKDNKLTVTPKNGDEQVFTWVESSEGIKPAEWTIKDGKIYINGYQYTNVTDNKNNTSSSPASSNSSAVSNNTGSSNSANSGSSSNSTSSKPGNSQSSSSSSSSNNSSNSSSTSSQPATAPTYEQGGDNDEMPIPEFIDNLDED